MAVSFSKSIKQQAIPVMKSHMGLRTQTFRSKNIKVLHDMLFQARIQLEKSYASYRQQNNVTWIFKHEEDWI